MLSAPKITSNLDAMHLLVLQQYEQRQSVLSSCELDVLTCVLQRMHVQN